MEDYDAGTQYAQEQYYYERDKELADLRAQLEQARALLWVWTDMDPLRYDNEYSACPWCAFDYTNMRHESDCAFVQARVFLGIEGGGSDADS